MANVIATRNAIAINNIGVELLRLQCYDEAAYTFEAAHIILEEAATGIMDTDQEDPNDDDTIDLAVVVEELANDSYQRAVERLYNIIQRAGADHNHRSSSTPYMITVVTWNNVTSSCYRHENYLMRSAEDAPSSVETSDPDPQCLYVFRMEDVESTTQYDNVYLLEGLDTDLAQFLVGRQSRGDRHNIRSYLESSIIVQNHGLACMCQANAYLPRDDGNIEVLVQCVMRSSYLLRTSTIGTYIDPNFDLVMRYSMSATGSAALEYWMMNLQLQEDGLQKISNLLSMHFVENNIAHEIRLLTDAIARVAQIYRDVVRVRSAWYPQISGSTHRISADQLDNVSPAA
jgi:hypothetical protein